MKVSGAIMFDEAGTRETEDATTENKSQTGGMQARKPGTGRATGRTPDTKSGTLSAYHTLSLSMSAQPRFFLVPSN